MSYNAEGEKRQKLIQWDEVTIAEHDRERGSRQKIDEAPTPYRYLSESDCESGGSDGEGLSKARANTSSGDAIVVPPPSNKGNTVSDSWEALSAKLYYEKHVQDCNDNQVRLQQQSSDSAKNGGDPQHLDISTEFGEIADPNVSPNTRNGFGSSNSNGGSGRSGSFRGKTVFSKSEAAATSNGNNNNSSSSNSNVQPHSILHHSHGLHHSNHNIHFSNPVVGSPVTSRNSSVNGLFSGLNGSIGGNSMENVLDESHDQFKSKRAGHYNEFKVVQAMRARMAAKRSGNSDEEEEEEGEKVAADRGGDHSDEN